MVPYLLKVCPVSLSLECNYMLWFLHDKYQITQLTRRLKVIEFNKRVDII